MVATRKDNLMPKRIRAKRIAFEMPVEIWEDIHAAAKLHNITLRLLILRALRPVIQQMQELRKEKK